MSAAAVASGACAPARRPAGGPVSLRAVTTEVAERSDPGLNVFQGGSEFLPGAQRFPFGLGVGGANEQITSGSPRLWVARGDEVTGPISATFERYRAPGEGDPAGFFVAQITVPDTEGVLDLLVEADGNYGFAAVVPVDEPIVPAPGGRAISTRTPTTRSPAGVENICTRVPACTMHDASLHTVMRAGKPIVFSIASPKLCTSRTCGPVLEEIIAVQESRADTVAFVHAEPYAGDKATTLSPTAVRWKIQSEPWTFVIDADGRIARRFEGPVVAHEIESALATIL